VVISTLLWARLTSLYVLDHDHRDAVVCRESALLMITGKWRAKRVLV